MRLGSRRSVALGLGLAVLALLATLTEAGAQVTYRTGTPPPDARPPIDTPPIDKPPTDKPPTDTPPTAAAAPVAPATAPVAAAPAAPDTADVNNPVKQTGEVVKDLLKGDVKALREGPLLIHGNYCGIGNRPDAVPTDALDEACMHHDACTREGKMPSCACDNRLQAEAMRIARDPAQPQKIQALATTMAASMAILICK